jgi:hypothetical protein
MRMLADVGETCKWRPSSHFDSPEFMTVANRPYRRSFYAEDLYFKVFPRSQRLMALACVLLFL